MKGELKVGYGEGEAKALTMNLMKGELKDFGFTRGVFEVVHLESHEGRIERDGQADDGAGDGVRIS